MDYFYKCLYGKIRMGRNENNPEVNFSYLLKEVESIAIRHIDIEQNQVGLVFFNLFQSAFYVMGFPDNLKLRCHGFYDSTDYFSGAQFIVDNKGCDHSAGVFAAKIRIHLETGCITLSKAKSLFKKQTFPFIKILHSAALHSE